MSNKKIVHYNLDEIDTHNALFNLIWGERSNGKSYQVKHKKAVEYYLKTGKRFILVRRHKDEITTEKIERYFSDVDVEKLTDGKYNCISFYRRELFLSKYDAENCKTARYEKIGYVIALVQEQNYAGASFLDVDNIIFEEFMARGQYLSNEPSKLMNLYCTVDRKRGTTRLWMVGNTISRICPYLTDWNILDIIKKQEQGTIVDCSYTDNEFKDENDNDLTIKIAIEHCKPTGQSSFTIGQHADMLNSGEWQSDTQPHLPKSIKDYLFVFRFVFDFSGFKFLCNYGFDKTTKEEVFFIYPKYSDVKNDTLVISDKVYQSRYYIRNIYNNTLPNRIQEILSRFREDRIFYATDLCGTDFKSAIDFEIRR